MWGYLLWAMVAPLRQPRVNSQEFSVSEAWIDLSYLQPLASCVQWCCSTMKIVLAFLQDSNDPFSKWPNISLSHPRYTEVLSTNTGLELQDESGSFLLVLVYFISVLICKKAAGRNQHMGNELLTVNEIYLQTHLRVAEPPLILFYIYFKQLNSR